MSILIDKSFITGVAGVAVLQEAATDAGSMVEGGPEEISQPGLTVLSRQSRMCAIYEDAVEQNAVRLGPGCGSRKL